ncbi:hypothetical protein BHE74_00037223 [Ensete ventricosum]|uniref:Uncharacterized protein n=1 Tax=Ensete ventricosum TaxID=4639 RepID=A0A426XRP0_ENSVE|nr:hypothetical protein B296_00039439 [Ensete ventricosum]RWW56080.1 hypothetical protein BHE74_00037223 [Ensete ventricosum]RZR82798.1 hypothetical protein BHM03_00009312 [Ensete ventricosum]
MLLTLERDPKSRNRARPREKKDPFSRIVLTDTRIYEFGKEIVGVRPFFQLAQLAEQVRLWKRRRAVAERETLTPVYNAK